jgi:hypothetical protein
MVCPKPHDFTPGASPHDPPKAELFGDKIMRFDTQSAVERKAGTDLC